MENLIELNESDLSEINGEVLPLLVDIGASKAAKYVISGIILVGGVIVEFIAK